MNLVRGAVVKHQFSSRVASASGLSFLRSQLLPGDAVKTYQFEAPVQTVVSSLAHARHLPHACDALCRGGTAVVVGGTISSEFDTW